MNLNLWQQTKPVAAGHQLVMALSKKSAQAIILYTFPLPGAYTGQTQLHTFVGLDPVVWYYQLFETGEDLMIIEVGEKITVRRPN